MIKVQSETSNTIYPSLTSVSNDANSNYYLMEVENEQTKRKVSKVITKESITSRSVVCSLDEVVFRNTGTGFVSANNLDGILETGTAWSVCLWFKYELVMGTSERLLVDFNDSLTPSEFKIYFTGDGKIKIEQFSQKITTFTQLYDDKLWHRLVVTQSGNNHKVKVYVDGVHLGNTDDNYTMPWNQFDQYSIGSNGAGTLNFWNGRLKDFQLWDAVLNGDDVKFDYDFPDLVASDRGGSELTARNLRTKYDMSEQLNGVIHNSANYNDLIDFPNDFNKWDFLLGAKVSTNVAYSSNNFKIASRVTYDGTATVGSVVETIVPPVIGEWRFGIWVKGEGNSIGKQCRLRAIAGTATIYATDTTSTITSEWQWIESYVYLSSLGNYTILFDPVIKNDANGIKKGDSVLAYGAKVFNTSYNLNASLITPATQSTTLKPMFDFDDNTFYKYRIYEQTNKFNTNIYDNAVIGLREEGKLFVQGISQPEYIKQKDADSTNEVYLEI